MSAEQFMVLQIRTAIAELPDASRFMIDGYAHMLRDFLAVDEPGWSLAIALVGAELAAKP